MESILDYPKLTAFVLSPRDLLRSKRKIMKGRSSRHLDPTISVKKEVYTHA